MDSETYYIPVNYTEAGKLFGLFEIRNAIEAVVLGLPILGLCARFSAVGNHLEDHRDPVSPSTCGGICVNRAEG